MTTKRFHLGDILSVTTGLFVSPNGLAGVGALLGFMTGDSVYDHQVPRVIDECAPDLLGQHPQLAAVEVPTFDPEATEHHVLWWLQQQVERFGEYLDVTPLAELDHTRIDPIAEFRMKKPDAQIITIGDED
jgi:hypothetical protein